MSESEWNKGRFGNLDIPVFLIGIESEQFYSLLAVPYVFVWRRLSKSTGSIGTS